MNKKLHISPKLSLPADAVTSTIVIYGGKGMGKTNLANVLVEEFADAGLRFSVIDPMGVWWGLRHGADGKGRGIKVLILGGIHGDLPITPESGALVADMVVDEDASVVIDISRRADGSMWAISERIRFVRDYAKRIYQRQGEKRRPIHQVVDEAARFAPQVVRTGEQEVAACMGAIAVLVEEGRNVGIGVTLVTQRSARLNKDVAELADCMIAFRIVGPNSMRAVLDWLGEHVEKSRLKEIGEQLRSLPRGSALVVSPGWLEFEGIVAMRKRATFDSSKTPEAGREVRATGAGAKVDLEKYRDRLAALIEEQKANDPRALRARVAELEKLLASKPVKEVPMGKIKIVEKLVIKPAEVARLDKLVDKMLTAQDKLAQAQQVVVSEIGNLRAAITQHSAIAPIAAISPVQAQKAKIVEPPRAIAHRDPKPANMSIGGGLRRILVALAQRPNGLTNRQIGIRAGLSSQSGTFSTYISRARQSQWIRDQGDIRFITQLGLEALGSYEPLPTGPALADYWLRTLGGGAARILRVLIDAFPGYLDNAAIGAGAKISSESGTFSTYVSKLRGLELIEGGRGSIRASEELIA